MYGIQSYRGIVNYVQEAVGEIAYDPYSREEYEDLIKKGRKARVRDLWGWLADELYNDSTLVTDLVSDKLFELIESKYGEDPLDKEVWAKHIQEMQKLMPHVTLSAE